jgi:hypothetical protein
LIMIYFICCCFLDDYLVQSFLQLLAASQVHRRFCGEQAIFLRSSLQWSRPILQVRHLSSNLCILPFCTHMVLHLIFSVPIC